MKTGLTKKNSYLSMMIILQVFFVGCGYKKTGIDPLQGDWRIEKYSIAHISAWSDDEAKSLIGGKLSISGNKVTLNSLGKQCGANLEKSKVFEAELKNEVYFGSQNGSFDLRPWGIQENQKVIEVDLNTIVCPFVVMVFFEKDQKLVAIGDGGAFLLSRE